MPLSKSRGRSLFIFIGSLVLLACTASALRAADGPVRVELIQKDGKWQLMREGQPYFIKGAGGGGSKPVLAECGGNSFRTWGVGPETAKELDEAQKLGLTVSLGVWLGHSEHGFKYDDPAAVQKQFDEVKQAVLKYRNHPALLVWSLGNEMEVNNDNPALWKAIQDLAHMVHELDPQHPTMTVLAEIGGQGEKVQHIQQHCPDIDIIGINTYGGGTSLADRYRKAGGKRPYIVTEYGPAGTWEIKANAFGAPPELTSTEKARAYRATYEKAVLGAPDLCLGSYAFTWGTKIEATSTWFGTFLPDGSKLAAVDVLQELWTGKPPKDPCPVMNVISLDGKDQVQGGDEVEAHVGAKDPQGKPLQIEWALYREQGDYGVQGTGAAATPSFSEAIVKNGENYVTLHMPKSGGVYRLYCYVRNGRGGAAVGSVPIKVKGPLLPVKPAVAKLPFVVYDESAEHSGYIASGYMGNAQAIKMEFDSTDKPHAGKHCLKITYSEPGGWGGVVWQHPANDWGEKPGGFDVSGAEKFSFWARGDKGGEKVKFGYGLIGNDKKYHDSSKGELEVTLTSEWKQYTLDLSERELSRIKTGFMWTVGGQGKPVTFYVDDVEFR
jgi:hypothetical protein